MYENSIVHPKRIIRRVNNDSFVEFEPGTIEVLDEFIKSGKKYFCIKDNFTFYYNEKHYAINFIVSQKADGQNIINSNITMTDFKKIFTIPHYKDLEQITDCLNHDKEDFKLTNIPKISLPTFDFICTFKDIFIDNISNNMNEYNSFILFSHPIALNAQSSKNIWPRRYRWYGETTTYAIVGYIINDV